MKPTPTLNIFFPSPHFPNPCQNVLTRALSWLPKISTLPPPPHPKTHTNPSQTCSNSPPNTPFNLHEKQPKISQKVDEKLSFLGVLRNFVGVVIFSCSLKV